MPPKKKPKLTNWSARIRAKQRYRARIEIETEEERKARNAASAFNQRASRNSRSDFSAAHFVESKPLIMFSSYLEWSQLSPTQYFR